MPQRLEGLERLAVLILRLFLGFAFMMHGSQKLLGAFGGSGVAGVAGMLTKLGVEPSQIWAWVLSITEFVGGVCVFLGFLTRFWAAGLVIDMAVAILKVHMPNGFFARVASEACEAFVDVEVRAIGENVDGEAVGAGAERRG